MLAHGLKVKVEYYIDSAVRVVAYRDRVTTAGGARFRPIEGQHTRVRSSTGWSWVDIDTGEIMASSDLERGALRSRRAFLSRVLAHHWDWFGTITLDGRKLPTGMSRRSPDCVGYVLEWLHGLRSIAPSMQYAVVPEHHKDGSFHFHVLMSGVPASLVVPARKGQQLIYAKGRQCFNFSPAQSALGFTSFSVVTSSLAVGRYMGKYLTKGFGGASLRGVGFRRWMVSRGVRPAPETVHDVAALDVSTWHEVGATVSGGDTDTDTPQRRLGVWVRYGVVTEQWLQDIISPRAVDVPSLPRGQLALTI